MQPIFNHRTSIPPRKCEGGQQVGFVWHAGISGSTEAQSLAPPTHTWRGSLQAVPACVHRPQPQTYRGTRPCNPRLRNMNAGSGSHPSPSHLQQMIGIRGCSAMKMPTRPWLIIGGLSQERWRRWKRVMQSSWQRTSSWNRIRQSSWQRWSAWRRLCRLWHGMLPARNLKSSRLASPVVASKALASPALALALIRHTTNQKDHHTNEGSRARLMPHCLSAAAVTPQHSSLTVTRRETIPAERNWRQAGARDHIPVALSVRRSREVPGGPQEIMASASGLLGWPPPLAPESDSDSDSDSEFETIHSGTPHGLCRRRQLCTKSPASLQQSGSKGDKRSWPEPGAEAEVEHG